MSLLKNNFSGSFYPNNPVLLNKQLDNFLANTKKTIKNPKTIIVPHAGYIFSGQVAAHGFKQLENETIKTIILLGPSHKSFHRNLALPSETLLETPLGNLQVDVEKTQKLLLENLIITDSHPHYQEHSLEVQLPFIKKLIPDCKVIPISVGMPDINTIEKGAKQLANIIDDTTIIIVSSDLSHYHSLQAAERLDKNTIQQILKKSPTALIDQYQKKEIECCGIFPIALMQATLNIMNIANHQVIAYDTSATTSFDNQHVVGYASIAFY